MKIYKYSSADSIASKSIVENGQIYFAPYSQLNDPFEFSFYWSTESKFQHKLDFWKKQVGYEEMLSSLSTDEKRKTIIEQMEDGMAPPPDSMFRDPNLGVFCCSKIWDNLVIWSHYAEKHSGICFEFETEDDEILNKYKEVEYSKSPVEFNLYHGTDTNKILSRKHSDWSYEDEVRVLNKVGLYKFNPRALKTMIIGTNTYEKKIRVQIKHLMDSVKRNSPKTEIDILRREHSTYSLKREKLEAIWLC